MSSKALKLITVPANGQISIGKDWAGRQIQVEVGDNEIHISAGSFIPDSQKIFHTRQAKRSLEEFNEFEKKRPARATDTKSLFSDLKKKKRASRDR